MPDQKLKYENSKIKTIKVFSRDKLEIGVLNAAILLGDIPRRIRLRNSRLYIYSFRAYRYRRDMPSPLKVLKRDLATLPEGGYKDYLMSLYNNYQFEEEKSIVMENPSNPNHLILGYPGKGFAYHP